MYIYNIGYETHEECDSIQLYHKKKFNKQQFTKIIHKAVIKILEDMLKTKSSFGLHSPSFQDIFYDVCKELEKNGFKKVDFDASWKCFGWSSVCTDDWKGYNYPENIELINAIPKKLRKQILKKVKERNIIFEQKMKNIRKKEEILVGKKK